MRYCAIQEHDRRYPIRLMCRALAVSAAGYYAWRTRPESTRSVSARTVLSAIRVIHRESRETYGSPSIWDALLKQGHRIGEHRVARLMRQHGIRAKTVKKWRATTQSHHRFPVTTNTLNRQFTVAQPNRVWAGDITYVWTTEGWLYLAGVMDQGSRRILGLAFDSRLDASLCLAALRQALDAQPRQSQRLIHHSDQGHQYASSSYRQLLHQKQILQSMSRKANCYDNAHMESFWATLKTEGLPRQTCATRAEARLAVFRYVHTFYNRVRLHSALGFKSPVDFEQQTN